MRMRQRPRLRARAAEEVLERLRPRVVEHGVERGVLLAVGDRVEPQHRRLRLAAELAQPQAQPLVAGAAADVDPAPRARASAPRSRSSTPSRTSRRRTMSEFGSRITIRRLVSSSSCSSTTPSE